jgi:hypothetical protein
MHGDGCPIPLLPLPLRSQLGLSVCVYILRVGARYLIRAYEVSVKGMNVAQRLIKTSAALAL